MARAHCRIEHISVHSLNQLRAVEIDLASKAGVPQNLVLMGSSGSGKTLLLDAIVSEVQASIEGRPHPVEALSAGELEGGRGETRARLAHLGRPLSLRWTGEGCRSDWSEGRFIAAYLESGRQVKLSGGVWPALGIGEVAPRQLVQDALCAVLVHRQQQETEAKVSGDLVAANVHKAWLLRVQSILRRFLHESDALLWVDEEQVRIDLNDGRRLALSEIQGGQASAVALWAELMLRVEAARSHHGDRGLNPDAVVLVDSIEEGLDVRLQATLLPALATLYPRVQWIVSTHSPIMALSLSSSILVDLGTGMQESIAEARGAGLPALIDRLMSSRPPGDKSEGKPTLSGPGWDD